jgi:nucleotide-binding universal stress UspA family protein
MSIKSILCLFSGERYDLNALGTAFAIRRECHARLRILHIAAAPILAASPLAVGGYGFAAYGGGSAVDLLERDARDLHDEALRLSRDYADKNGVGFEIEDGESGAKSGRTDAIFRTRIGAPDECLNAEGRTVDLIVSGFDNQSDGDQETVRAGLYQTGRPMLLLPRIAGAVLADTGFAATVALAWDGSLAAARAMRDALPFLLRAKDVYVLMVEEDGRYPAQSHQMDLVAYLESHGIIAECLHLPRNGALVGETLLEKCGALGAEMLVMGAYGRGHMSEALFGGATRYALQHSQIPLLLSH